VAERMREITSDVHESVIMKPECDW